MPQSKTTILEGYKSNYVNKQAESMSFSDYLALCASDKEAYATATERLLAAIGEPEIIDTANDKGRLGRIFQGKTIARYPAFSDFYGAEETIEQIVSHLRGAADGTEYKKQVLYLLGPVGGGKSSLGDRLKQLMESKPIYVLKSKKTGKLSPINESPLGLFDSAEQRKAVSEEYDIPERYLKVGMSPWAVKRLREAKGDIDEAFEVVKIWPSQKDKIAVAKIEPGDDNNQDTSVLVGKLNINALGEEGIEQNDTDAYLYSGGFAYGNQGIMEFVEMFKAPLKVLNPMLEATQSGHYSGTENIGVIPFSGLVFAHSNESEWKSFSADKRNEAILDRINVVHVPYTLRMKEEAEIYNKMLRESALSDLSIAPKTIDMLAKFSVLSRLSDGEGVAKYDANIRAQVLNGEIPEAASKTVPTIGELKKYAPLDEGMNGVSTRFAFKTLTETFNARANEGERAADPVLMMEVLEKRIKSDGRISDDKKEKYLGFIKDYMVPEYAEFITREITTAFTGASDDMCQNMFDRYINMADAWISDEEFNDKGVTGKVLSRDELEAKLAEIEKPAGIVNAKDFRNEVTRYVLKKERKGEKVAWNSYEKMAAVIRDNLGRKMKDVMPVIKFDSAADEKQVKKRDEFIGNMKAKGYTLPMIKRAVGVYENTMR